MKSQRWLAPLAMLVLSTSWGVADSAWAGEEGTRIYGGVPTETCEWPTTVGFGHCTGTLIHPRVVLTAAHCGSPREIRFGERYRGGIAKTVRPEFCKKNPGYNGRPGSGGDSHFCVLPEPIKDVPIAPIAYGCEVEEVKAGAKIWLVGFGEANGKTAGSGVKHKVEVPINKVKGKMLELNVGGDGKATCYGDSGGPAFMKLSDGTWRTVGITSYGTSSKCGYPSGLTTASSAVKWIQDAIKAKGLDIDLHPCYDDDGTWNPTSQCKGFALEPGKAFGNWKNMCSKGAPRSGLSSICGPKHGTPKGQGVKIGWANGLQNGATFSSGEKIEVSLKVEDPTKRVSQLLLAIDDHDEKKAKLGKGWTLRLEAGEFRLVARAVDEDGEELAKSKGIEIVVEEDSTQPTSSEVAEIQDSQEDDSPFGSDDDAKSGAGKQDEEGEGGCRLVGSDSGRGLGAFALLLWVLRSRRRADLA